MQRKHTKYGPKFAKTDFFSGLVKRSLRSVTGDERLANTARSDSRLSALQKNTLPKKIHHSLQKRTGFFFRKGVVKSGFSKNYAEIIFRSRQGRC